MISLMDIFVKKLGKMKRVLHCLAWKQQTFTNFFLFYDINRFLLNSYPELIWTLFECDRMKNAELDRETGYLCSLLGASALFYPDQLFIQFSLIDNFVFQF